MDATLLFLFLSFLYLPIFDDELEINQTTIDRLLACYRTVKQSLLYRQRARANYADAGASKDALRFYIQTNLFVETIKLIKTN